MEVSGIVMPGYRVYEYLLVLNPHEELRNRILHVKKEFNEKYKATASTGGKPHLALCRFLQYEMMEDRLMNRLKTIAMGYYPLKIELKDFGSFPSHSIYINVISKMPVQNLVKEIRSQAQKLMKLNEETKPHFIMDPHIIIATKLLPWQYEKSWEEYRNKHFTGRFIADGMLLLKRSVDERPYTIVEKLQFQNLPVVTKQGELFV